MKKTITYLLSILLLTSCNSFSDDFFEFLFNSPSINIDRKCSDSPSIFGEGRYFEIYDMSSIDQEAIIKNILDTSQFKGSDKYPRYEVPLWIKTPVLNKMDTVFSFINTEMGKKANTCFNKTELTSVLQQNGNYYTFLNDNLGRVKLFVWDVKMHRLYLATTYEL